MNNDIALVIIGRAIGIISAITFNAFIARVIIPEDVGAYFIALSCVSLLTTFVRFGIEDKLLKIVADQYNYGDINGIHRSVFRATRLILITFSITILVASPFYEMLFTQYFDTPQLSQPPILYCLIIWLGFWSWQTISMQGLRSTKSFFVATLLNGGLNQTINILCLLLLKGVLSAEITLTTIMIVVSSTYILTSLIGFIWLHCKAKLATPQLTTKPRKNKRVAPSLLLFLNQATQYISNTADIWIVAIALGITPAALYGAATRLAAFVGIPLIIMESILPSKISKCILSDNRYDQEKISQSNAMLSTLPSIAIFFIVLFFSSEILEIIFGAQYQAASDCLRILSIYHLSHCLMGPSSLILLMNGYHKILTTTAIIGGLAGTTTCYAMLQHFPSIETAATTFAIANIATKLTRTLAVYKYCGIKTYINIKHLAV